VAARERLGEALSRPALGRLERRDVGNCGILAQSDAGSAWHSRSAICNSERGLGHGAAFTRQLTEGNRSLQDAVRPPRHRLGTRRRARSSLSRRLPAAKVVSPLAIDAAATAVEQSVERHRRLRRFVAARLDPAIATGLALTIALVVAVGGGFVLAVLAYLVRGNHQLRSIDNGAADWGHAHATALSTHGLNAVTNLGSLAVVIGLAVVLAVVESIRVPSLWIVPFLVLLIAGNEALMLTIKELADRARPTLNPVAATLGPSFPSGHSATAAAFYAGAALLLARRRSPNRRSLLAGAAIALAVAVASSRVLLDVHWLSDVIAGVMLGWGWFAVCSIAFGGRLLRFGAPAKTVVETVKSVEQAREPRRPNVTPASGT
jgi:undecaprenyl-diphosphatase